MKVKVTRTGFYGTKRRREGEVFSLKEESHFSPLWMESVEDKEDEDFFEDEAPKKVKRSRPKSVSREEIKDDVL